MASIPDNELEFQLEDAGNKLLDPPTSVEEILSLLDNVESSLSRVEQSPSESMQAALAPSLKALVSEQLFRHTNIDVRVAVASCISEITRITAPDAPYSDDQMKDVFQLIVSAFEDLADITSRSYVKRTLILETVANVRSCVVMLDLECDALIIEMFEHFLNSIRDHHPSNVFSSMETIMSLVLEESEDISVELLSPLLMRVKRGNQNVLPVAQKLGEKVIEKCATKIMPYLARAFISLGIVADDCTSVVASACASVLSSVQQIENNEADDKKDNNHDELLKHGNEHMSKAAKHAGEDHESVHPNISKEFHDREGANTKNSSDPSTLTGTQASDAVPVAGSKKRGRKPNALKKQINTGGSNNVSAEKNDKQDVKTDVKDSAVSRHKDMPADVAISSKKKRNTGAENSVSKDGENDSETFLSPAVSGNRSSENQPKKLGRPRKKVRSTKGSSGSKDVASKVSKDDSEAAVEPSKPSGIKESLSAHSSKDILKKDKSTSFKSSEKEAKHMTRKTETDSTNGEKANVNLEENEKRQSHGKGHYDSNSKIDSKIKDAHLRSTPETVSKRKHTQDSSSKAFGSEVVGLKVKVWWPRDRQFYEGAIESFDSVKKKHKVVYIDGDVEYLNLKTQRFEFIHNDTESSEEPDNHDLDGGSELPLKKKLKSALGHSKKEDVGSSSTKLKSSSATKHRHKSREVSKTDGKMLDDGKGSKREVDGGEKIKDPTPKGDNKSVDILKGSSRQKSDDKLFKSSKSKEESKSSKSKHETPKSGRPKNDSTKVPLSAKGKPSAKDSKQKTDSYRREDDDDEDLDDDDEEENTTDSGPLEQDDNVKMKITFSSKGQGSEKQSNKKRRA